ncbi:hypothetical protein O9K63_09960 [Janibacter cremeus]|uniref:hypothetical protein n=1 Tax=Janibacter cremeus TaxID=1285192 RepID=UPI0023F6A160|nr:hypothetical protein [Janibacter cremeus]WEV76920.1 hypothetical protein O9K63_09960 [Janibacter cremeus]
MSPSPTATDDLTFRRQFYLGPDFPDLLAGWTRHRVNDRLGLSVHPDLTWTRADLDGRTLILLGYALDPRRTDHDDQAIIDEAIRQGATLDRLISAFHPIAGRWAAIYVDHERLVAFHDATGSRQVFHCRDADGTVHLGSSAGLLARITRRPKDTQALQQLEREGVFRAGFTHFWPGSGSAFVGINRLLPNHHLDVVTGDVERFWPCSPIPTMDPDEAAALSISTLSGVISAASTRYPLALSLSAGFDSRLLLAACRTIATELTYYSYKRQGKNFLSPDVRLPQRICRDLGLRHKVIDARPQADGSLADAIAASVVPFHQPVVDQASALRRDPPRPDGRWVTVNGNVAEVAQRRLRRLPVTPENLARNARMSGSAFAMEHLSAWHSSSSQAFSAAGADPWDLLYWEHKMGGWYATIRTEFDVSEEVVTPYNSRAWLAAMLGVDPTLRSAPDWPFFRDLIGDLWPRLLDYPFNPPDRVDVVHKRARSLAKGVVTAGRSRKEAPEAPP